MSSNYGPLNRFRSSDERGRYDYWDSSKIIPFAIRWLPLAVASTLLLVSFFILLVATGGRDAEIEEYQQAVAQREDEADEAESSAIETHLSDVDARSDHDVPRAMAEIAEFEVLIESYIESGTALDRVDLSEVMDSDPEIVMDWRFLGGSDGSHDFFAEVSLVHSEEESETFGVLWSTDESSTVTSIEADWALDEPLRADEPEPEDDDDADDESDDQGDQD